ncbi:MAG: class I SAM-dependent methyltransferase [Candidatus Omnitrophota bacterium]|jgi:ubiquinone/menaquinone biosynthesis C-methylase UbiE
MNNIFDLHSKQYDAWYSRHEFAFLSEIEAIKKVLPPAGNGLEIGVGTGRFASSLGIATGVDPSNEMLRIAKKRGVNTHLGFGETLPFPNKVFDYVAVIITLCFVENPKEVVEEIHRVLKKNGKIIIGIVDRESFLGKFYQHKESMFYKKARFFSVTEVTELLKESDFSPFSCYQTISILPNDMKSVEKSKKGFGKGGFVVIAAKKRALIKNGSSKKIGKISSKNGN